MSDKMLQTARFTAQQLASAVVQINSALPIKIDVVQCGEVLFYVAGRTDSTRTSGPLRCSETTLEQLVAAVTEICVSSAF